MGNKFTDKDASRLAKILGRVVADAKFELGVNEFVEFFNELDWASKELIPKIQAHVFEINQIKQAPEQDKKQEPKKKSGKKGK